jgi:hypothetical protein
VVTMLARSGVSPAQGIQLQFDCESLWVSRLDQTLASLCTQTSWKLFMQAGTQASPQRCVCIDIMMHTHLRISWQAARGAVLTSQAQRSRVSICKGAPSACIAPEHSLHNVQASTGQQLPDDAAAVAMLHILLGLISVCICCITFRLRTNHNVFCRRPAARRRMPLERAWTWSPIPLQQSTRGTFGLALCCPDS